MDNLTFTENIKPILNLFLSLAEHFGLLSAVAFILLSTLTLQRMVSRELTMRDKVVLMLFFGLFGIFGTYDGDPIQGVIANLRAISMILAGLIGGPVVGTGAGLIAGVHRFLMDMDGFSSLPCALGTLLEGTVAGYVSMRLKDKALHWRVAVLLGFVGESVHMALVLVMSSPFETALGVVRLIGLPMIVLNAAGAGCLIEMIRMVVRNRERRASIQARQAMGIANRTVAHLRQGLNEASALATAKIVHEQTHVAGVAITDNRQLLAYVGIGDDMLQPGQNLRTSTTNMVLATGHPVFAQGSTAVGEEVPHRMFESAIVVPLKKSGETIGALKLYGDRKHPLNPIDFEIANGLAHLFSTQLELEDIQLKAQLLARAKIKWLEAQINPHFLFNALNTITFYCRIDQDRARELVISLSTYLRRNLEEGRDVITLAEELEQAESYLSIAKARSGDTMTFHLAAQDSLGQWPIPPLIVQPLVENAVKHGLAGKTQNGAVWIRAQSVNGHLQVAVKDNGVGMQADAIEAILRKHGDPFNPKIGLRNVIQRLEQIYGPSARLSIDSRIGEGTTVTLELPKEKPT